MAAAENKRFITDNRDLSWLKFNDRVLEEAEDPSVPLLERMNFVTIYSTNFDEFLRVRIGKLHHQVINDTKGKAFEKPESPGCVLEKIYKKTAEAQRRADRDFHEIRRLLAEGDYPIKHLKPEELTEEDRELARLLTDKEENKREHILSKMSKPGNYSVYRDRLIKRGIINARQAYISLALPFFGEYIKEYGM